MLHATSSYERLKLVLRSQGIDAALAWLNGRTPYRFTATYAIHSQTMRNTHFFDRVGGFDLGALREVPLMDSFCQYVVREGRFATIDSAADARLDGHPYQGVVASYVGLPVVNDAGVLVGTFCHWDLAPHPSDDRDFEFLQSATRLLSAHLE
jgi:GAF domain-containing protein